MIIQVHALFYRHKPIVTLTFKVPVSMVNIHALTLLLYGVVPGNKTNTCEIMYLIL